MVENRPGPVVSPVGKILKALHSQCQVASCSYPSPGTVPNAAVVEQTFILDKGNLKRVENRHRDPAIPQRPSTTPGVRYADWDGADDEEDDNGEPAQDPELGQMPTYFSHPRKNSSDDDDQKPTRVHQVITID